MKDIIVIGSGARECSIIKKLKNDCDNFIICIGTNNNPYIVQNTRLILVENLKLENIKEVVNKNNEMDGVDKMNSIDLNYIDFVIIGPEDPLAEGVVDYFNEFNIECIGPTKFFSQIESSKIFTRKFMSLNNLDKYSPKYKVLSGENVKDRISISNIIDDFNEIVVKKDGLCGGKGVKIENIDYYSREDIIDELTDPNYGEIDSEKILLEERLYGEEFSLISFVDKNGNLHHCPPAQDNKRLLDNDKGPNTGGMGCVIGENNMLPFLNPNDINVAQFINEEIIKSLNNFGKENGQNNNYSGIIYGSYIKCKDRIYVIEFNSRFGDPEGPIIMELLENNFYDICKRIIEGTLNEIEINFSKKAIIGTYLVPTFYPNKFDINKDKYDIYFLDKYINKNLIYGSMELKDNHIYSLGSRTMILFELGEDLNECYLKIYKNINRIVGNLTYREDIGFKLNLLSIVNSP